MLRVHDAGGVREYLLGDRTILGRDRAADICVQGPGGAAGVGRRHAAIERCGLEFLIHDAGSILGVLVAGERVERRVLRDGDVFHLAEVRCEFVGEPALDPAAASRVPAPVLVRVTVDGVAEDHTIEADTLVGDFTYAGLQVAGGIRRHARLIAVAGTFWIEALDGTMRVGEAAVRRVCLTEGLVVDLGATRLEVRRCGAARLRVYAGEDPHAFVDHRLGARTRIGTRRVNDIVLSDSRVTREHCVVALDGAGYTICDLHSTNGVLINGEKVESRTLRHGDRVTLGQTTCVFLEEPGRPTPAAIGLAETFTRAGLPEPPVPEPFAALVQAFAPWWFGTRRTRGLYQYGAQLLAEAEDPQVLDYLIIGHAGPGGSAFSLHYYVRLGPLLVVLELGAAGGSCEPEVARQIVTEAFAAVQGLVAARPGLVSRGVPRAGLQVAASTLRASHWRVGVDGGEGDWRGVLRAALAWAESEAAYTPRPAITEDVSKYRFERPPASEAVARVRVYAPDRETYEVAIGEELIVGRHTSCEVHLSLGWVSRRHCRLFMADGFCWIEDLGSAQGTRVEGQTIKGPCLLGHGARVAFGAVEVVFCEAGCPAPPPGRR